MNMRKACYIVVLVLPCIAYAQDPAFSQYYAAPLYLNPAFAGTASNHRVIANHRNQWPSITNGFVTYAFSYDYNFERYRSGLGILVMTDKAGTANLRSTQLNVQYAYKVSLSDKWVLSSAVNFGGGWRNIDFNKLVFGDQLEFDGTGNTPSDDPVLATLESTSYFDFGAGILAYSRKFWLGFSAAHLNQPNLSLINESAEIPVKYSFHGGVRIPLYHGPFKKERVAAIMPSFVYKQQGKFDQLDLGTYFFYEPIIAGLWYRGIPVQQDAGDNVSHDAVMVALGFQFKKIEFVYSYDLTISRLGPANGGAHELALKYLFEIHASKPRKRGGYIPCPTFNH